MDNNEKNPLPKKFLDDLADIPSLSPSLYAGIRRRIKRKTAIVRTVWAVAASLIIMVTAFQVTRLVPPANASVAEASEELSTVDSYINSDVYRENDNSYGYYEETLYQE
jgi:hypothetical protein